MIKAFLFDRDGVILDSEFAHINAVIETFKKLGIKITKEDEEIIIGRHPDNYLPELKKKYDFSSESFLEIETKFYYKYFKKAPIFKEVINLMKKLKKKGYKIAITTSSDMKTTNMLLERIKKLSSYIDVIVTREDYKKSKPDPEPYLITAKKLNISPKDCVVIEDSLTGLKSAKSAGMKCIMIPTGLTKKQDFKEADLVVKSAKYINIKNLIN
jgi:HAD superfamily hydrolase (TIGR01509 family)